MGRTGSSQSITRRLHQPVKQVFVVPYPVDKLADTVTHGYRGLPFKKLLRFLQIAHKYGLISGPPITPLKRQASFKFLFKISNELEQRHGIAWPAADIEGLTAYCLATIESRFVSAD